MLRKRLQMHNATTGDESERDGSDSSCSESVGGSTGAFRPTPNSPKDANNTTSSTASYPSPNISVGPPIHPGPHLLPYLYPHGRFSKFHFIPDNHKCNPFSKPNKNSTPWREQELRMILKNIFVFLLFNFINSSIKWFISTAFVVIT